MHCNQKKCKKCFLSPDICGANSEKECNSIYENKWRMYWEEFKEFAPIAFFAIFIIVGIMATVWHVKTGTPFPWEQI